MALSAGTRLGPYEILAPIGAGGMGEVYRAKDAKLDRDVAIKVLPPSLAQSPGRLARFEREAKVLASLNHLIFYTGADQRLMAVEVAVKGDALELGAVRPLFGLAYGGAGYPYDLSADGQRILEIVPPAQRASEPLTLVQNWTASLKK